MNNNDNNEKPFSLADKWDIDSKHYKDPNYKAEIGETQCYRCSNRIKGNTLKCSKFDSIPIDILSGKEKCKYNNNEKEFDYSSFFNSAILNLPKTEEDNRAQKKYDIIFSILILVPLFVSSVLVFFNHLLIGLLVLGICWALCFILSTFKKKNKVNEFYKIKDAHNKFNIVNVNDENIIKELYNNSALTFIAKPNDELLNFIYNWLYNEKVLKSDSLNAYIFDGYMLKKVFEFSRFDDNTSFICIFNRDLNINETNKSFYRNHSLVGSRWLDDIIDNDKES